MKRFLILTTICCVAFAAIYTLPSCTMVRKGKDIVEKAQPIVGDIASAYMALKDEYEAKKAEWQAKESEWQAELEMIGAPTGSAEELFDWAKSNPIKSLGSIGTILSYITLLIATGRRKKKTLETVVAAVDDVKAHGDANAAKVVLDAIEARAGRDAGFSGSIAKAQAANVARSV